MGYCLLNPAAALSTFAAALLLAAASPAFAQPPGEAAATAPSADKTATPPMWRVTDDDSEIFLLGTFHILPPGLEWRSDSLAAALDAADTLWFEAEVDTPAAKQKTFQILMTEGFNPAGKALSGMLDPADAVRFGTIVESLGLPLKAVDPMRPWQAFLTLSVQFIVKEGFDPASGVETVLLSEARAGGRTLKFFETVEEQLRLFSNLSPRAEKDLLVTTLREWDQYTDDFDDLFIAWSKGDVGAIDAMMNEDIREAAPEVYDVLVTKRNAAWAKTIAAEMAGAGTELVAVGAGHLVGEGSVPALLKARGFKVERYGVAADAAEETSPAANDNAPEDAAEDAIGDLLEDLDTDDRSEE